MKKDINIDRILKGMSYGNYYCESSTVHKLRKKLFNNPIGLNCSDEIVKYNDLSEKDKIALIYACMRIVFEDKDRASENINMLNKIYDFDLVYEFNKIR